MTVPAMDRRAQLLAARVYLIVTPETLGADAEARVAAALASGAVVSTTRTTGFAARSPNASTATVCGCSRCW